MLAGKTLAWSHWKGEHTIICQHLKTLGQELPKQNYHPVILSQEVGLIIVPGAHLPGESYMPLLREIQVKAIRLKQYLNYFFLSLTLKRIVDPITPLFQASYPGPLWIGSTAEWLGDMPTPIEVTQQVSKSQKRKKIWSEEVPTDVSKLKSSQKIGNCLDAARSSGLSTDDVFMAGHR